MKDSGSSLPDPALSCPVPPEQRPLREYEQLCGSWFFAWPAREGNDLGRALAISWLMVLPVSLVVASGSIPLRHHPGRMLVEAALAALALPLLLLARQWLGWTYVRRRLLSDRVEYEESGWYDGQVWDKPPLWRQQDLLVANHQVGPVLDRLRRGAAVAATLLLAGAGLCQAL